MDKFKELGICEPILKSLIDEKFQAPSEIQEKTIPLVLAGKDVIAGSATGSGKTLAFASGIIQNLEKSKELQALILTPTRELAEQITQALKKFSKYKKLDIAPIYGGVSIQPQIYELKYSEVVVATPGRILDHIDRNTINLTKVKILVLDEADRMLDMGFIDDVKEIIKHCPKNRQTLLFSATITKEVADIAEKYMKKPVEISAKNYVDPGKLTQVYYDVQDGLKFSLLVHLLKNEQSGLVMVFCNTKRNTDFVAKNLKFNGIDAVAIHGGYSQNKRSSVMTSFHNKKVEILICTDVASRGLDIKDVSHVYNYDIPNDPKDYIHRIGRTARAGENGKAISILASRDYDNFSKLSRICEIKIKREETPIVDFVKVGVTKSSGFRAGRFNRNFHGRGRSFHGGGRGRPFRRR